MLFSANANRPGILRLRCKEKMNFKNVIKIKGNDWPLPKSMYKNLEKLVSLEKEGYIELKEKFGMKLFYTSAYVAFN